MKFSGTRAEFVDCGLMTELDEDENNKGPMSPVDEKTVEEAINKPVNKAHKSLIDDNTPGSEPESETSSIAPEDEATLTNSTAELKSKPPRKLVEDEKRAKGRIAWSVWATYFKVSLGPCSADDSPSVARSGVCDIW